MKKWGTFHKVCTRDGQASVCRVCDGCRVWGIGRSMTDRQQKAGWMRPPLPFAPQRAFGRGRTLSGWPSHPLRPLPGCTHCAFNNATQHTSYGVAPVFVPIGASNSPRLQPSKPGSEWGGGGPRNSLSVNYNSSPHLKIFCATGPRLAPHLRALRLTRYWHATTFCPGA